MTAVLDNWKPRSIYEALAVAKDRIGVIGKDDTNKDLGYSFRGIDSILNRAGPIATELGIIVYPQHKLLSSEEVHSQGGTRGYRVVVESTWTFSVHVTREEGDVRLPDYSSLIAQTLGEAIDYSDKAVNKAQRQSEKNAWQQVLSIPTGEPDPDSENPTQTSRQKRPSSAEEVLQALTLEGFSEDNAKHYAREAMESLELEHPIPEDRISDLVALAIEIRNDAESVFEDEEEKPDVDHIAGEPTGYE